MTSRMLVIIAVLILSGCGDKQQPANDGLVNRGAVAIAFASIGEPLTVGLDMAEADPGSVVDVIFVPKEQDVPETALPSHRI